MSIRWIGVARMAVGVVLMTAVGGHGQAERSDEPAAAEPRGPVEGQNWISPATGMEFVWIPQMNLWVGKTEVTNAEYRRMHPDHDSGSFEGHCMNGDRQPVLLRDFDAIKAYIAWLTEQDAAVLDGARYRLPIEEEWETYARCGDDRTYPWGDEWPPPSGRAGNYSGEESLLSWRIEGYDDGFPVTAPVDRLWANPWGLHGVGGNVWEACARDRTGERLAAWRGASWVSGTEEALRISFSFGDAHTRHFDAFGFRLVLSR